MDDSITLEKTGKFHHSDQKHWIQEEKVVKQKDIWYYLSPSYG